jgi:hypothetical protein
VLAIGDEAGVAVAEREGAVALISLGGSGGRREERHAGDSLPHRVARRRAVAVAYAWRRRNPGQRDVAAAGQVLAEANEKCSLEEDREVLAGAAGGDRVRAQLFAAKQAYHDRFKCDFAGGRRGRRSKWSLCS